VAVVGNSHTRPPDGGFVRRATECATRRHPPRAPLAAAATCSGTSAIMRGRSPTTARRCRLDPSDTGFYADRGLAHLLKADYPQATADLAEAIARLPEPYPMPANGASCAEIAPRPRRRWRRRRRPVRRASTNMTAPSPSSAGSTGSAGRDCRLALRRDVLGAGFPFNHLLRRVHETGSTSALLAWPFLWITAMAGKKACRVIFD
jgi:hypothetical protein